jgi:tetratricopeptide (TPR) repeat protein
VELLEPLLDSYLRVAELHHHLGQAHVKAGNLWLGVEGYERAMGLSRNPNYWYPLALVYADLKQNAHALHAFRQVLRHGVGEVTDEEVRQAIAWLEHDVLLIAQTLILPMAQTEKGLHYLEEGDRALHQGSYRASVTANRLAIKLLGDWPPPRNNLSQALFHNGQPKEAVETARQVLAQYPDNVQAMSNAVRFLAWMGQEAEAQELWSQLKAIMPEEDDARLKAAEAGAAVHDDETVYALLKPLEGEEMARPDLPGLGRRAMRFLAIAEANLGKHEAQRRLRTLLPSMPWLESLLEALEAGRPGLGWAGRFPYFRPADLLPRERMEELVELIGREERIPPKRFEKLVARFAERFPQIVLLAEKLIWEEMEPEVGIAILAVVRTQAANAVLRRFGLSQAGDDDIRMEALSLLSETGEISSDETLRIWLEGEWTEARLRQYEITDEPQSSYASSVAELLSRGLVAYERRDLARAEGLFQHLLELEPRAKEAHNNLATIYAYRGEHERAKEMYHAALKIDPLYVLPRCNLATYLLDEGDLEAAKEMLKPLNSVTRLHPQDMAFYSYTQARILIEENQLEAAKNALEGALAVWPGYTKAEDLVQRLEMIVHAKSAFGSFWERQRERERAKRLALQKELATPDPSLSQALPLYTKEALVGTGRVVLPEGGWSALCKSELVQLLVDWLADPANVQRIVADLGQEERDALQQVCAQAGSMPWCDFDAKYGNDLDESRYWQWFGPETTMGRLRLRGLLVEATVEGELLVVVPVELRPILKKVLG